LERWDAALVIRQFDVIKNQSDRSRNAPYLLVLQHELLSLSDTVVVAPLRTDAKLKLLPEKLVPTIVVAGRKHRCVIHQLAAVDRQFLGKTVGNAAGQRDQIVRAYDIIISGV
jgi:toxin CcdB